MVALVPFPNLRTTTTTTTTTTIVVVVQAVLDCPAGPTHSRLVEHGSGDCQLWGPNESEYDCCVLCNESNSIAAQYIPPGGREPFGGFIHNDATCCCYSVGEISIGDDGLNGSIFYLQPFKDRQ